jgi:acetyltransferase-like isoleucine patch superfamily enzyme
MIASSRFGCMKKIEVGYGAGLSETRVMDTDFHQVEVSDTLRYNTDGIAKPVRIGANVWLCNNSMVLKGVTIGDNTVIGAGAVVYENMPSNVVAIGNPARVVWHLRGKGPIDPSKNKKE